MSAACNKDRLLCDQNLKKAFNKIDSDRDGFISQKEMRRAFGINTDEITQLWKELLGQLEPDEKQKISFKDFKNGVRSLVTPKIEVIESTIKDVLDKLHQNNVSSNSIIQEEDKASESC